MSGLDGVREEIVPVGGGRVQLRVQVCGEGPPLVFLHASGGLRWDRFLTELARERTVYAPLVPGTSPADPDAIDEARDLWELVLLEQEALLALGLAGADVIGASFGGMLACELQATFPGLFGRLVALAPTGLWRDDAPVANTLLTAPADRPALLFADPEAPEPRAYLTPPEDPAERAEAEALATWTLGCTARFWWPVPDRGLARRLHRITAPTLIVWGERDAVVPVVYAREFARRIAGAEVEILKGGGHVLQVERREETLGLIRRFLAADRATSA
jgi:pimeloyl-ACP methyl ester carboxylesterase